MSTESKPSIASRLAAANPAAATVTNTPEEAIVEAQATAEVAIVGVDTAPAPAQLKPSKGEVLFESKHEGVLVTTSLDNGKEVTLPYLTSVDSEITWLREFAEHTQLVTEVAG